jgi:hypothetical protein
VTAWEAPALTGLLWVRCPHAERALQAMDLLLRDGNFPLLLLDLKLNPENQLRKIPATTWYRLQRLAEMTATVCVALTPRPLVAPARVRLALQTDFSLADLERDAGDLLRHLKWERTDSHSIPQVLNLHSA